MDIADVIAPLEDAHWEEVRAIYLEGLATNQASFETDAPDWPAWDAAHLPHSRLVCLGSVTDDAGHAGQGKGTGEGRVLAWAALSPVSRRAVYRGVAEVSVYVAGPARGQGLGRHLLDALVAESEAHGIWTLQASIFPENTTSIRLFERCGFRLLGRRHRIAQHYGTWRDTVIYERRSDRVGI